MNRSVYYHLLFWFAAGCIVQFPGCKKIDYQRAEMTNLKTVHALARQYKLERGIFPTSLDQISGLSKDYDSVDHWGTPLELVVDNSELKISIASAGEDCVFGTDDDLVWPTTTKEKGQTKEKSQEP
jgi:hypothetical protein